MPENNDKNTDKLKDQEKETSNEKRELSIEELKILKIDYLDL